MPKVKAKLTDTQIKSFKPKGKAYKKADDAGLSILVRPSGTKVWQYRYTLHGKANIHTIGQYPEIGAAEARTLRDTARALVRKGIDPNETKRQEKKKVETQHERTLRFVADDWFDKQVWVAKHAKNIRSQFEKDVYPALGGSAIDAIKASDIVPVIKKIEGRGAPDVAKRTAQHLSAIYEYAINHGLVEYNPAMGRAKIIKSNPVKHRPHLSAKQIPEFLLQLDQYVGTKLVKLAMKFLMLTMVRPGELRNAPWEEIDEMNALWRIPANRMKMKRVHIVPLSTQALRVLAELREISGKGTLLFPGNRSPHSPISDVTLLKVIQTLGYHGKVTPHGMRGTASTILNEHGFRADVIERQLAHVEKNKIRGAYNHAEYLDERRNMMQWWGDFIEKLSGSKTNA